PADAVVCTMLFSRMVCLRKSRSTPMEITAAGMDADTVMPANRPRYAFAPASTIASRMPSITALTVTCAMDSWLFMDVPFDPFGKNAPPLSARRFTFVLVFTRSPAALLALVLLVQVFLQRRK